MEESKDDDGSDKLSAKPIKSSFTPIKLDPEVVALVEKMQERKVTADTMSQWLEDNFELIAEFQTIAQLIDRAKNCKPQKTLMEMVSNYSEASVSILALKNIINKKLEAPKPAA